MKTVNLAEAKAKLSALVEEAEAGEIVCITKHGKPIAQLVAASVPKRRIGIEELRQVTKGSSAQKESAGEFIRRMRDDSRY